MTERASWRRDSAAALSREEVHDLQAFLADALREAGPLTLAHFRRGVKIDDKGGAAGYDPVTEADRAAERALRARIRQRYPEHGLLGEEFGHEPGASPLTWVIDPIDGTRAFVTGALHWGMLVALFDGVRARLGAMYQPYTDELFAGADGEAWLERGGERTPLATRDCAQLSQAVLCSTTPEMFATPAALARFEAVAGRVRMCRYGGDCYSYCMLAMGQLDLVIESSLQPYDVQALIPIVESAGGGIVNWRGESPVEGGSVVAYGDPRMRDAALELLDAI